MKNNTESNKKEKKLSQETVYMWMILYDFFRSNGFYETKQKQQLGMNNES
jgi:hypothetical protein